MITKTQGYADSGGKVHATLGDAQRAELMILIGSDDSLDQGNNSVEQQDMLATWIMRVQDRIIDILTTGPRSRPAARKVNKQAKAAKTNKGAHERVAAGYKAMRAAVDAPTDVPAEPVTV